MLLKLKGIVTFKQFRESSAFHDLVEDMFIGDVQVRKKLEEAQLKDNVFLCFETHYLRGPISYFDKNSKGTWGRSIPENELIGLTDEPFEPTPTLTPFCIGESDLLAVFRAYLSKEIILWATDKPFTQENFADFGIEYFQASKWDAALMCWANLLYISSEETEIDHSIRLISYAIVSSNLDTIFDRDGLHTKIHEVLNRYLPQNSRLSITLKSLSHLDLYQVGTFYLERCTKAEERNPTYAIAAIPFLQEAINLSPEHAEYYYYLNQAIVYGGKIGELGINYTSSLLDKAISLDPTNELYYETRASAYTAMREPELAAKDREKVISLKRQKYNDLLKEHVDDMKRQFGS